MQARRISNEYTLQYALNDPQAACARDEVDAELAAAWGAKDLILVAVPALDRGERLVRPLVRGCVVELDIVPLRAADSDCLLLRPERMPCFEGAPTSARRCS